MKIQHIAIKQDIIRMFCLLTAAVLFFILQTGNLKAEETEMAGAEDTAAVSTVNAGVPAQVDMPDGEYSIETILTGGSGKASVASPTLFKVEQGKAYVKLTWSSSNYDYMIVGEDKYLNEAEEDSNSEFWIPLAEFDTAIPVIADTTAMGTPHEIAYTLTFYSDTIGDKSDLPQEAAKKVVAIAMVIIVGGGILNHILKKRRAA